MVACLVDLMRLCRAPTLRGLTNRLGVASEDRAVGGAGIDVDALVVHIVVHFVPKRIAVSEAVCEREESPAVLRAKSARESMSLVDDGAFSQKHGVV